MDASVLGPAANAASTVLVILTVRSLPIAVRFSARTDAPWPQRGAAVVMHAMLTLAVAFYANFDLMDIVIAYGYFAMCAIALYGVAKALRYRSVLFVIGLLLLLGIPALTNQPLRLSMLLLGWDFLLASYSYVVSAPRSRSLLEFLEFVLVNPALVYALRGERVDDARVNIRGLLRSAVGVVTMFFSEIVPFLVAAMSRPRSDLLIRMLPPVLVLVRLYAAHSALASIQIGLYRQLGIEVPERYLRPLGASSPKEFWRRWNTYVGTWTRIYVFQPLAFHLRRRWRWVGATSAMFATIVSFTVVGLLHDAFLSLSNHKLIYTSTIWFIVNGAIVIGWEAAARVKMSFAAVRSLPSWAGQVLVLTIAVMMSAAFPN